MRIPAGAPRPAVEHEKVVLPPAKNGSFSEPSISSRRSKLPRFPISSYPSASSRSMPRTRGSSLMPSPPRVRWAMIASSTCQIRIPEPGTYASYASTDSQTPEESPREKRTSGISSISRRACRFSIRKYSSGPADTLTPFGRSESTSVAAIHTVVSRVASTGVTQPRRIFDQIIG